MNLPLPGGTYAAGQVVHLRFQVTGSGSTALSGKAWFGAAAEPAAWHDPGRRLDLGAAAGLAASACTRTCRSSATNAPVTRHRRQPARQHPRVRSAAPPTSAPTAAFADLGDRSHRQPRRRQDRHDADGNIETYAWTFGDGQTATSGLAHDASHTYAAAGTYTVALTVTDDDGATRRASQPVTVDAPHATRAAGGGPVRPNGDGRLGHGRPRWERGPLSGTASNYSVSGGTGADRAADPRRSREPTLAGLSAWRTSTPPSTCALDKAPTGSGTYLSLVARKVGTTELPVPGAACGRRVVGPAAPSGRERDRDGARHGEPGGARGDVRAGPAAAPAVPGDWAAVPRPWPARRGSGGPPSRRRGRSRPPTPPPRSSSPARLGLHAYVSSSATNAPTTAHRRQPARRPARVVCRNHGHPRRVVPRHCAPCGPSCLGSPKSFIAREV